MFPMRPRPLTLLLCLIFVASGVEAEKDKPLERWQERVIEALEQSGRGKDRGRSPSGASSQSLGNPGRPDPGASSAAARAQQQHGGRALAVIPANGGYRVRLLMDDGRVVTVQIRE